MQRARADRGNAPVGGTGRNFCFGFLSYMWRSSVDRDRSRSCLGAGGAAVRWRLYSPSAIGPAVCVSTPRFRGLSISHLDRSSKDATTLSGFVGQNWHSRTCGA